MVSYLLEIKNRFVFLTISILLTLLTSYYYKEVLLFILINPLSVTNINSDFFIFYFIFTDLVAIFTVYFKIVFFVTIQVASFYLVYQTFAFLSFALYKSEYNLYKNIIITCFVVWVFSLVISYFLLVPISWKFFFSFQSFISNKFISLHFEPKIDEYLNFYLTLYYSCIFYFQLFFILFILIDKYNSSTNSIKKVRKFYYLSFFVFSTIVSPPDVFSQLFISFSLTAVYEVSVLIVIFKKLLVRQTVKTN
jgi:sec-independent protein translocase protein TatC